eukprot:jgi/Chrpa1/5089/Chrysochromulina_OHIO_Genome00011327-RA
MLRSLSTLRLEECAERRDAAGGAHRLLVGRIARGEVGEGRGALLSSDRVRAGVKQRHQPRKPPIDSNLVLVGNVIRGEVAQRACGLLGAQGVGPRVQQRHQRRDAARLADRLLILGVIRGEITERARRLLRRLGRLTSIEQGDQLWHGARLADGLLVEIAGREVGERACGLLGGGRCDAVLQQCDERRDAARLADGILIGRVRHECLNAPGRTDRILIDGIGREVGEHGRRVLRRLDGSHACSDAQQLDQRWDPVFGANRVLVGQIAREVGEGACGLLGGEALRAVMQQRHEQRDAARLADGILVHGIVGGERPNRSSHLLRRLHAHTAPQHLDQRNDAAVRADRVLVGRVVRGEVAQRSRRLLRRLDRLRSAPAAFCAAIELYPPASSRTRASMPPAARIRCWLCVLLDARLRSAAAACSAASEAGPCSSTSTRSAMPPASAHHNLGGGARDVEGGRVRGGEVAQRSRRLLRRLDRCARAQQRDERRDAARLADDVLVGRVARRQIPQRARRMLRRCSAFAAVEQRDERRDAARLADRVLLSRRVTCQIRQRARRLLCSKGTGSAV